MTPEKLGSVIGAVFGLIFVMVNTGSSPAAIALLLRVLAVLAFWACCSPPADRESRGRRLRPVAVSVAATG